MHLCLSLPPVCRASTPPAVHNCFGVPPPRTDGGISPRVVLAYSHRSRMSSLWHRRLTTLRTMQSNSVHDSLVSMCGLALIPQVLGFHHARRSSVHPEARLSPPSSSLSPCSFPNRRCGAPLTLSAHPASCFGCHRGTRTLERVT